MSNQERLTRQVALLWLSGMRLEDIEALPEAQALLREGALATLEPAPITGPLTQSMQASTGRLPASSGFFDTLLPHNYAVTEVATGRAEMPRGLPEILSGWQVHFEETTPGSLVESVERAIQHLAAGQAGLIIKCAAPEGEGARAILPDIGLALGHLRAWVGESGLLAVCSERQNAQVEQLVNLNNFLAEMGVIELDEESKAISWENSLAYFAGHGQLWLNLLGRDAQGAVHPQDEAEEVRETLVRALPARLRDPRSGRQVIERVYRKEELYSGEFLFCAPDLVVVFAPGYAPSPRSARIELDEETFTAPTSMVNAGAHPSQVGGFLLAAAPGLLPAARTSAPLAALTPTLLHALGVEYAGMDEAAISSLFSPAYLETHPIRGAMADQGLSEEDEELIINRLRDLGYV